MSTDHCIIMTTVADDATEKAIIDALLSERLAACIQVLPMQSWYRWKGEVCSEAERLLVIKTRNSLYSEVESTIVANHTYETPEVLRVAVEDGLPAYLNWIDEEVR